MNQSSRFLWAILIIAAVLRIGGYIALRPIFAYEVSGTVQGFADYDAIARNLNSHGEFTVILGTPYAGVAPLYPHVLALTYGLFGRGSLQVVVLNTVFDLITVVLLAGIGRRLLTKWAGLIAAALFACYPYLVFQSLTVIDTPLYIVLLHAFVFVVIVLDERPNFDRATWVWILLAGVLLGLLTLTRPLSIIVGGAAFLWYIRGGRLMLAMGKLLPVAAIAVLLLIPWNLRNLNVMGTFVNIGTHAGMNFWFGNSQYTIPFFKAGYHTQWAIPEPPPTALNSVDMDRYMMQLGLEYLREHPEQFLELTWVKLVAYWSPTIFPTRNPVTGSGAIENYQGVVNATVNDQGQLFIDGVPEDDALNAYSEPLFDRIGRLAHFIYYGGLLVLSLFGTALARGQWSRIALIWYVQLVMTVAYVVMSGPTTRYRVPTDPLLFLLAAYALLRLTEQFLLPKLRETA
jgi:4-amino-4-deoxy-L-arabinose transferase-like glycosyltransferase